MIPFRSHISRSTKNRYGARDLSGVVQFRERIVSDARGDHRGTRSTGRSPRAGRHNEGAQCCSAFRLLLPLLTKVCHPECLMCFAETTFFIRRDCDSECKGIIGNMRSLREPDVNVPPDRAERLAFEMETHNPKVGI
jgi:hypothetical protein